MSESIPPDDQLQRDRRVRLTQWVESIEFASRSQIAKKSGFSRQNFARYLDGSRSILSTTAEEIARGWGYGPEWCVWLLYGGPRPN